MFKKKKSFKKRKRGCLLHKSRMLSHYLHLIAYWKPSCQGGYFVSGQFKIIRIGSEMQKSDSFLGAIRIQQWCRSLMAMQAGPQGRFSYLPLIVHA